MDDEFVKLNDELWKTWCHSRWFVDLSSFVMFLDILVLWHATLLWIQDTAVFLPKYNILYVKVNFKKGLLKVY